MCTYEKWLYTETKEYQFITCLYLTAKPYTFAWATSRKIFTTHTRTAIKGSTAKICKEVDGNSRGSSMASKLKAFV